MGLHQTKQVLHSEGNLSKMKRQTTECKMFAYDISEKRLISKLYKELIQLHTKRQTIALKMGNLDTS